MDVNSLPARVYVTTVASFSKTHTAKLYATILYGSALFVSNRLAAWDQAINRQRLQCSCGHPSVFHVRNRLLPYSLTPSSEDYTVFHNGIRHHMPVLATPVLFVVQHKTLGPIWTYSTVYQVSIMGSTNFGCI